MAGIGVAVHRLWRGGVIGGWALVLVGCFSAQGVGEKGAGERVSVEPRRFSGLVAAHNHWRRQVGVPELHWSDKLSMHAQQRVDSLAARGCQMEPRSGQPQRYGENIAWSVGYRMHPPEVVGRWVEGRYGYDYAANWCASVQDCHHYTQVVWRATREVGCATALCPGGELWVCQYHPAGNAAGEKPY